MRLSFLVFSIFLSGCATQPVIASPTRIGSCQADKPRQEARSKELQEIVNADQEDREDFFKKTPEELREMALRDVERRKRVGEIFGEGCFLKAEDFAAAALVYQHGDVPEHYLQAFMWAKRAVELGDEKQKRLMGLAIDRYLVNTGHKQLFASQATKTDIRDPNSCWCLQQIEPSFPDDLRKEIANKTFKEAFDWLEELNKGTSCPNTECAQKLKPSPKGTVPGFW